MGLLIGLISILFVSANRVAREEGERRGTGRSVEQSEHTQHLSIKFAVLCGRSSWRPQTINNSNIRDHHNRCNNSNEKV
jgi:hypothetical protein